VILLGCAHSGVVNTMDYICELSGHAHIHALIGGMHLGKASDARLGETVRALQRRDVKVIVPCHCTGENATHVLRHSLPGRVADCAVGSAFEFP